MDTFSRILLSLSVGIAILLSAHASWAGAPSPPEQASAEALMAEGAHAFQRGSFAAAASRWAEAARLYERAGRPGEQSVALIQLAQAYQGLGEYRKAVRTLELAQALAEQTRDPGLRASVLAHLGNACIVTGPPDKAARYLNDALELASAGGPSGLAAAILNNLGNLLARQQRHPDAIDAYRRSAALADQTGRETLAARALVNAARASQRAGQYDESRRLLALAADRVGRLAPSHDKALSLVGAALTAADLRRHLPGANADLTRLAATLLTDATTVADAIGDPRVASYAWGYLGRLYEDERRWEEALGLTRRAVFLAQQSAAPESLYRWQWQGGRLLHALGKTDDAIAAYRRAVSTLQSIRQELPVGYTDLQSSFRESVGPVYVELVDLLLQRAAQLSTREEYEPYLAEARDAVELVKAAELQDYFRDDCVDAARARITRIDVVSRTAVVVYPILLPDRLELLVGSPAGLTRYSVPVTAETVTGEVRQFRRLLEKRTTREYLPHAQRLYDWLIRPLEPALASPGIDTLIFVPDGPLRTVPMAALHDGARFLIERYAVAVTPGLNLTDPHPLKREQMKVLTVGLTESAQGFPSLPHVSTEVQALRALYGGTLLMNDAFRVESFRKKLQEEQFSIVHIASHAQFAGDVERTFLLTFDDKLTIDRLERFVGLFRFRDMPLELLTLSACETAAGDDRAALGLAGIAVKAGARSALATLWYINDQASSELVAEFYRQLQDPSTSKATALRRAQSKLLADPRYAHPALWSPFLLINNWL